MAIARGAPWSSRSAWRSRRRRRRRRHRAAREDAEARAGQHGLDPVRPHPVFRRVAQVDLGERRRLAAGEHFLVLQPEVLGDRPHGRDLRRR